LGDRYWLTERAFYSTVQNECEAAYELLSDQTSRNLFVAILRLRLLGDCSTLPKPQTENQYFPLDLPAYEQPLRFIDCGAYQGDCIEQILSRNLELEAVAAFEPDDANYVKLTQFVTVHRSALPNKVYLFPCGVDGTARKVRFSSGQGVASRVDNTGDTLIQCAAIDEALPGFSPNFIKMDIEGAELSALWGARRTILEHRPALAVSLYHKPAHLWQLPLLVANWYGNQAKYYLRSHGCNGFELVLYVRT
jgi:FkbM family methyltransferase